MTDREPRQQRARDHRDHRDDDVVVDSRSGHLRNALAYDTDALGKEPTIKVSPVMTLMNAVERLAAIAGQRAGVDVNGPTVCRLHVMTDPTVSDAAPLAPPRTAATTEKCP